MKTVSDKLQCPLCLMTYSLTNEKEKYHNDIVNTET